jgi:hypothetical protein
MNPRIDRKFSRDAKSSERSAPACDASKTIYVIHLAGDGYFAIASMSVRCPRAVSSTVAKWRPPARDKRACRSLAAKYMSLFRGFLSRDRGGLRGLSSHRSSHDARSSVASRSCKRPEFVRARRTSRSAPKTSRRGETKPPVLTSGRYARSNRFHSGPTELSAYEKEDDSRD